MRHGGTFPRFLSGICTICAGISEDGGAVGIRKAEEVCKAVSAEASRKEGQKESAKR